MDSHRVDALTRFAATRFARRTGVAALGGALLGILSPALGGGRLELAAKRKKGKKKAKKYKFLANPMIGANEVPPDSGDENGLGSASFTSQGTKMCGIFTLSQATSFNVTGTHIHQGAAGVEGNIVVDFGVAPLGVKVCVNAGSFAKQIKNNPAGFYANIHTDNNPSGAVRAQLQRV